MNEHILISLINVINKRKHASLDKSYTAQLLNDSNLLAKKIGEELNKKIWLPNVPSFVLKFLYGEMSDTILKGVKVSNKKIKDTGFKFKYEKIEDALREIYF